MQAAKRLLERGVRAVALQAGSEGNLTSMPRREAVDNLLASRQR
jgi:hypothetical protein